MNEPLCYEAVSVVRILPHRAIGWDVIVDALGIRNPSRQLQGIGHHSAHLKIISEALQPLVTFLIFQKCK
ncbi:MAG: hypothetical protein IGQ88_12290 [Gloeomargaritaceae cyanobacterium C42_A2020_066]|nr:hypothetical protein [Gloeomargaritaceae cyanobacterium C42_A2020_066]